MLELKRIAETEDGTFGVLLWVDAPFALSLERKWCGNERGKSCIPSGNYLAVRCNKSAEYGQNDSPTFGDTFVVTDVPDRCKILFHKGNIDADTHGCIVIAEQFGRLYGKDAVLSSKAGFDEFKRLTTGLDHFNLKISKHY